MVDAARAWQLTHTDLHWHCWNQQCLLYDAFTGDTHLLDAAAAAVLRAAQDGAQTAAVLAAAWRAEGGADEEFEPALQSLAAAGLVQTT